METTDELRRQVAELDRQLQGLVRAETALYETRRRVDAQLEIHRSLGEISRGFAGCTHRDEILLQVCRFAVYTLNFQRAAVFHLDGESRYEAVAWEGWYGVDPPPDGLRLPSELPCFQADIGEASPRHAPHERRPGETAPDLHRALGLKELVVVPFTRDPLLARDVLVAGKGADPRRIYAALPPDEDVSVGLANLVAVAATALSNVEFYEALVRERTRLAEKTQALQTARQDFETRLEARTRVLEDRFAKLRESQRLEAVGRLAAGVAHDFNNVLTIIKGSTEYLGECLPAGHEGRVDAEAVLRATDRAASLIRQLLAFGRNQVLDPRPLDLNRLLAATRALLVRSIGETIELSSSPARRLWTIRADPTQLEQVVVNLALNARDAMPRGGRLRFCTSNLRVNTLEAQRGPVKEAGDYVHLAVSDTGKGIPPELLPYVFDPFVTTKSPDRGTGLGLASVYGIVRQSRGWIWVESEVGRGSTFHVALPRVDEEEVPSSSEEEGSDPFPRHRGGERVLVVEDDERIRSITARSLERWAYRVEEAGDGEEALERCRRCDAPFELIVTDVVLPKTSAPELIRRLPPDHARCRVLYVSGYSAPPDFDPDDLPPGTAFLKKPFGRNELARSLQELFDGPERGVTAPRRECADDPRDG